MTIFVIVAKFAESCLICNYEPRNCSAVAILRSLIESLRFHYVKQYDDLMSKSPTVNCVVEVHGLRNSTTYVITRDYKITRPPFFKLLCGNSRSKIYSGNRSELLKSLASHAKGTVERFCDRNSRTSKRIEKRTGKRIEAKKLLTFVRSDEYVKSLPGTY